MVYSLLTRIYPKKIREHYAKLFQYSKLKVDENKFFGFFLIISLLFSIAFAFFISFLFHFNFIIILILLFLIIQLTLYFGLSLKADYNARFVENVLPDALQLMTSNLRAGLTTDRAFLLSARPEFGTLSDEINEVGKKITLGKDLSDSLLEMSNHFKSDILKKTMLLITSGLKSGGELTELLEQTAKNLRQEKFLEDKIRTNVLMYVIFIFSAIAIGSPILFGLSSFLVEVLQTNLAQIEVPKTATLPISFSKVNLSSSFILTFSVISLLTSSILGSLVLGLISKGKEKAGLKFVPILVALTLAIFFATRFILKLFIGGLFGL